MQGIDLALGIQWVLNKYYYLSFSGQWVFWKQHDRIEKARALKSERIHFHFSLCHFLAVWLWTTFFPSLSQVYLICQEGEMYLHCRILVKKSSSPKLWLTVGTQLIQFAFFSSWNRAGPCGAPWFWVLSLPISCRQDSRLQDLPWFLDRRFQQLLFKGGAAKKPFEARVKGWEAHQD